MHSTEHHRKLNSPEAAEYLGISVSTLSKRRVDGDGPQYLKPGRRVVYEVLEQMRQAERDGWSTVEHHLSDRELREQQQ